MSYSGQVSQEVAPGATESRSAAKRYEELKPDREPFLMRARDCARLTISSLFRNEGDNGSTDTQQPWQSFGAHCVKTLSSKLALTIFPPGISPVKFKPTRKTIQELAKLGADEKAKGDLLNEIEKGLVAAQDELVDGMAVDRDNAVVAKGMRYMIVGGNHGFQQYSDGKWRGFSMERFVVLRDGAGNVLEAVVEDPLVWETLPKQVQDFLKAHRPKERSDDGQEVDARVITLFSHIYLENGRYEVYQEACGYLIPDTEWSYDKEDLPWLFPPFNLLPGENYGRSYVEDYLSDLQAVDGAEEIITEGSAAAALLIRTVKPGGVTSKDALARARNGAVITGDINEIGSVQSGKGQDFAILDKTTDKKLQRLAQAFLLLSGVQRDAERVTAEEFRKVAQELNEQLGGIYFELVDTLQVPWLTLKMKALMRTKRMVALPKDQIEVQMATGAAALSRDAELDRMDAYTMPPNPKAQEEIARITNWPIYARRRANLLSVTMPGLVKSDEVLAAEAEAMQKQQMMLAATPNLVKAGGDVVKGGLDAGSKIDQIETKAATEQAPNQSATA